MTTVVLALHVAFRLPLPLQLTLLDGQNGQPLSALGRPKTRKNDDKMNETVIWPTSSLAETWARAPASYCPVILGLLLRPTQHDSSERSR